MVRQTGSALDVQLKAPTFDPNGYERHANSFKGIVETGRVAFFPSSKWRDDPRGSHRRCVRITYLSVFGAVTAAPVRGGYAGTLDGTFEMMTASDYYDVLRTIGRGCTSVSHQFTLTR